MPSNPELLALDLKKDTMSLKKVAEVDEDSEEWETSYETETIADSERSPEQTIFKLGVDETRMVTKSKLIFILVLIITSAGCAAGTFLFTKNSDRQTFETAVEEYANEINTISQLSAGQVYGTLDAMTKTVTAYAKGINATWPYVVINEFDERGKQLLKLSGASGVAFLPIVPKDAFDNWTQFTIETNAGLPRDVKISPNIFNPLYNETPDYAPLWQRSPPRPDAVNRDFYRPDRHEKMLETRGVTLIDMYVNEEGYEVPSLVISAPIFEGFEDDAKLVGYFTFVQPMDVMYKNILQHDGSGMFVVVDPTDCRFVDNPVTFYVDGPNCTSLGVGDLHDPTYDELRYDFHFTVSASTCDFKIQIYPSKDFEDEYMTDKPLIYSIVVVALFAFTSVVFCIYDSLVEKRQVVVLDSAEKTGAIVSSLFPEQFRDRLLEDAAQRNAKAGNTNKQAFKAQNGNRLPNAGIDDSFFEENNLLTTKPLAEFFPNVTVMFSDIAGFTAWASIREPAQVFTLLEQIYSSFDAIAKRKRIFKVETIGDCYVAAAGLPEKRDDHAVVMARFATECRYMMNKIVRKLEVLLRTPDAIWTAQRPSDCGYTSGRKMPIPAVRRHGEHTCARLESTGMKNMIQLSEDTANLLMAAGLSDWVRPRDDYVSVKGKGAMQTYWLTLKRRGAGKSVRSPTQDTKLISDDETSDRMSQGSVASLDELHSHRSKRLIQWNVEVLLTQLKKIVAMRDTVNADVTEDASNLRFHREEGKTVLDEVQEVIPLSTKKSTFKINPEMVLLDKNVATQLEDYVTTIASMYRDNSFHNFEHASHVTMSVTKLLNRVVSHDTTIDKDFNMDVSKHKKEQLHEYSYGITSDPIIHFACALSALIHDVDHTGVPNATLIKENAKIASFYKNQSVAEQNSVDLAWELLMEPRYDELRACLCTTHSEMDRFRHLVVNCVMATDIVDKELGALRKNRWKKAFEENIDESNQEHVNRKATIVIEHIIQASDVSHTMQHWHVYLKWNERFFHECYRAYLDGRAEKDPSETWVKGELGFFDFYIIPLAKKLKECQVFGVTSDEFLNYAMANRKEWEVKGEEVLKKYMEAYKK